MSDYISREAAIEAIKASRMVYSGTWGKGLAMAAEKLRDLPAADVVEIKKPDHGYMWICPKCGLEVHSDYDRCVRCGWERRADG